MTTAAKTRRSSRCVVGLISDTHGLWRPQARDALAGSDLIVHAGDVGSEAVLDALRALAPLAAVRGNNDHGAWAAALPETLVVAAGGIRILVIHDLKELHQEPGDCRVVVSGHTHRPAKAWRDGSLFINPGSAGPRRFRLPVSVGRLVVDGDAVDAALQELEI